jgi:transposase-like protein
VTMGREERWNQWRRRVASFRASGQTQAGWCRTHGVCSHQLRIWMRRFPDSDTVLAEDMTPGREVTSSVAEWMPLALNDEATDSSTGHLIVRVGRAEIEVRHGFDASLLADVVKALSAAC